MIGWSSSKLTIVCSPHGMQMQYVILFFIMFRIVFHLIVVQGRPRGAQTDFVSCAWLVWMAEVDYSCIRRDPSVLQLAGASRAAASIPFQLYHLPDGHFEKLTSWVKRTMSGNSVETMFGLHDMVCGCMYELVWHLCAC